MGNRCTDALFNTYFPPINGVAAHTLKSVAQVIAFRIGEKEKDSHVIYKPCFPSHMDIAERSGLSIRDVVRAINALKSANFVRVKERYKGKGQTTNLYSLPPIIKTEEDEKWVFRGWDSPVPNSNKGVFSHPIVRVGVKTRIEIVPMRHPPYDNTSPPLCRIVTPPVTLWHRGSDGMSYLESLTEPSSEVLKGEMLKVNEPASPPPSQSDTIDESKVRDSVGSQPQLAVPPVSAPVSDRPERIWRETGLWDDWNGDLDGHPEIDIRRAILYVLKFKESRDWYVSKCKTLGFVKHKLSAILEDTPPRWMPPVPKPPVPAEPPLRGVPNCPLCNKKGFKIKRIEGCFTKVPCVCIGGPPVPPKPKPPETMEAGSGEVTPAGNDLGELD